MKEHTDNVEGLTLYGAGGHCKVIIDVLESLGEKIDLLVDDFPKASTFMSYPCTLPKESYDRVIVSIGDCQIRKKIVEEITARKFPVAIHPSAHVSDYSTVGEGSVVFHGAVVQPCASIGRHCIINTNSAVEHDAVIHDFTHVASGAAICGGVEVGECTLIGARSVVKQGIHIGNNCVIGAGSVVVRDIPDNAVAYGNPCRVVKPCEPPVNPPARGED